MQQNLPTLSPHPFNITEKESKYQTKSPFGQFCSFIPVETSGSYQLTDTGIWSTSDSFFGEDAQYNLKLVAYSGTFDNYKSNMTNMFNYLNYWVIPNIGATDITTTLGFWMTFAQNFGNKNSYMSFAGDLEVVFKSDAVVGYISNRNGVCSIPSFSALSTSTMTAYLSFSNSTAYVSNDLCMSILNTSVVNSENSQPVKNQNNFQVKIDVISVIVALSLNLGIFELIGNDLFTIVNSNDQGYFIDKNTSEHNSFNEGKILYVDFTYELYPGMSPIKCFIPYNNTHVYKSSNGNPFCGVPFYNTIGIPIFSQKGGSTKEPSSCAFCRSKLDECFNFDFIYGIATIDDFNFTSDYTLQYGNQFQKLAFETFNAQFIGSYWGQNTADPSTTSLDATNEAYKYCYDTIGCNCSFLLFSSVNMDPSKYHFVTPQGYEIDKFCTNNFLPDKEIWDKAINNPPANFEENYMICTTKPGTLFINSAGVSVANMFTLLPLISLVFSAIVLVFVAKYHVPVTYSESDKAQAIDAFATALLLARDKRLAKSVTKQDFVLNEIVSNLEYTANLDTFLIAKDVEETRRAEVIEFEMSRMSTISANPMSNSQGELGESVILNNYHLDRYKTFKTLEDFQQFVGKLISAMKEIMRIRHEIHGDRTDIHNKSAYVAVRGIFADTANLKNAHFECFEVLAEGLEGSKPTNPSNVTNPTSNPINPSSSSSSSNSEKSSKGGNRYNSSDRFSVADRGPEIDRKNGKMVPHDYSDDGKTYRLVSELMYIHGKLAIGENMSDTLSLSTVLEGDLNFSKRITYQIGPNVISLQDLIDYRSAVKKWLPVL